MEIRNIDLRCDVLIVGGGIGGLACALSLKEQRPEADILVLEKQTAGYAGKANKGGGVLQYFDLEKLDPVDFLRYHASQVGCYLGDQALMLKYVGMNNIMLEKLTDWGVNVPKREDGRYNVMPTGPMTAMVCVDLDITLQIRRRAEKLGVRFLDKTALSDLLTKDGQVVGAAAYSILENSFYTVLAKKVVLATGSQNYRIGSMWSSGRGDGIAAAYRAGAEMRNAEFGNFAQLVKVKSHNEVVFGENYMYNAAGEFITPNFRKFRESDISSTAIREWYVQMKNGQGPVHLDYGAEGGGGGGGGDDFMEKLWDRPYGKKFRVLNDQSGAQVDKDLEVCPMFIGEQSPIRVDHHMRTTLPGLYAIGDCSYAGSGAPGAVPAPPGRNRGSGILNALFAALCCAEHLAEAPLTDVPAPEEGQAAAFQAALYAPLRRNSGYDAKEVIALVQQAMAPMENSVYMEKTRMEAALQLVETAAAQAASMKARDLHGLLSCREAEAMVLSARMHYRASLLRQESRGWFLREDYPEMDNENWLKWIIVKNEDGEMKLHTEPVPIETWPVQP